MRGGGANDMGHVVNVLDGGVKGTLMSDKKVAALTFAGDGRFNGIEHLLVGGSGRHRGKDCFFEGGFTGGAVKVVNSDNRLEIANVMMGKLRRSWTCWWWMRMC
jgi:hypothetical protein